MKVKIIGLELNGLQVRFENDGDEIVNDDSADLIVTNMAIEKKEKVWGGDGYWNGDLTPFNLIKPEDDNKLFFPELWASMMFDGEGFINQVLISWELKGMMERNGGAWETSGWAGRFSGSMFLRELFLKPVLIATLKALDFKGWISFGLIDCKPTVMRMNLPDLGNYGTLELVNGKLSKWMMNPCETDEYWIGSLLVSRSGFPERRWGKMDGIMWESEDAGNIWSMTGSQKSNGVLSNRLDGVVVTGKSLRLGELGKKLNGLAERIRVKEKQVRWDIVSEIGKKVGVAREWKLI